MKGIYGLKHLKQPLILKIGHGFVFLYATSGKLLQLINIQYEGSYQDEAIWLKAVFKSIHQLEYRGPVRLLLNDKRSMTKIIDLNDLNLNSTEKRFRQIAGAYVLKGLGLKEKVIFGIMPATINHCVFIGYREQFIKTLATHLEKIGFWISGIHSALWVEHLWFPFLGCSEPSYQESLKQIDGSLKHISADGIFKQCDQIGSPHVAKKTFNFFPQSLQAQLLWIRFIHYGFLIFIALGTGLGCSTLYLLGKSICLKHQINTANSNFNEIKDTFFEIQGWSEALKTFQPILLKEKNLHQRQYESIYFWQLFQDTITNIHLGYLKIFNYILENDQLKIKFKIIALINDEEDFYELAKKFEQQLHTLCLNYHFNRGNYNSIYHDHQLEITGDWFQ